MDQFQNRQELQEKTPPSTNTKNKKETILECYYCTDFQPTVEKKIYETHVTIEHPRKLAYPSAQDLKVLGTEPKGKKWE